MQTQMLVSVVDSNRKAVEADPTNAAALSELAKSLFELSMLQMRDEARATLKEGLDACQKSIAINPSESAVTWVRGVLQQAYSMVVPDASLAATLKADAQADFSKVLNAEKDSKKRDTLVKEKELLSGILALPAAPTARARRILALLPAPTARARGITRLVAVPCCERFLARQPLSDSSAPLPVLAGAYLVRRVGKVRPSGRARMGGRDSHAVSRRGRAITHTLPRQARWMHGCRILMPWRQRAGYRQSELHQRRRPSARHLRRRAPRRRVQQQRGRHRGMPTRAG
jgi:hypothetical protein